jgi:ketopantoate reductase
MRNEPNQLSPIILVGPGALGIGLAHCLVSLGYSVRFLGHQGPISVDKELRLPGGETFRLQTPCAPLAELKASRLVLFAVKAFALEQALHDHKDRFDPHTPLVPVGNGLVEPVLACQTFGHPWRLGVSTMAVTQLSSGVFSLRHFGKTSWGGYPTATLPTLFEQEVFEKGKEFFNWLTDPLPVCRRKWLFNTALNSLCGVHGLSSNGEAFHYLEELKAIFHEAYVLGQQLWGTWPFEETTLFEQLLRLVEQTRDNENSMARDLRLGQPSENDYLAGVARDLPGFPRLRAIHQRLKHPPTHPELF